MEDPHRATVDEIQEGKSVDGASVVEDGATASETLATTTNSDKERRERFTRRGLLVCSSLSTFFFVGSFFGWGPMQLLVSREVMLHQIYSYQDTLAQPEGLNLACSLTSLKKMDLFIGNAVPNILQTKCVRLKRQPS